MNASSPSTVAPLVDHLFRRESGRLVAMLARRLGAAHLHVAEDVVQDALVAAMQTWPFTGIPDNPTAWLLQTARNRALDQRRRDALSSDKERMLATHVEACLDAALASPEPHFEGEIADSQLRMMFVCCHPGLLPDARVALTLRTLCGFGEAEIAAAFLVGEDAITKRLVRARRYLREHDVSLELPPAAALPMRVEAVRSAIYLLFSEGYKASRGDVLIRADLCTEALRLGEALCAREVGDTQATHALLALMYFDVARAPARVDAAGTLLLLAEQDRSLWSADDVRRGLAHLAASTGGPCVTRYHLEAGIAACHALAPDYAATDWPRILELYDRLLAQDHSPVVALIHFPLPEDAGAAPDDAGLPEPAGAVSCLPPSFLSGFFSARSRSVSSSLSFSGDSCSWSEKSVGLYAFER